MSGKYLLDTNVVIALFVDDPAVKAAFAAADRVVVPSTAIGELYYGAWKLGLKGLGAHR
jgi:tRNA(fMet)-specific endonuclease VapC